MGAFDDKQFFDILQKNPQHAFRLLMDGYRDKVFISCRRACSNDQDAQDLAQETFIRVWKGIQKFERKSSLSTWIYHIAWNVCASYLEKKGNSPIMSALDEDKDDVDVAPKVILSEEDENIDLYEKRNYLARLFRQLPEQHRLILTLYYVQEQTYDEISKITGWPLGTVKATLHRAKANLRKAAMNEDQVVNHE